MSNDTVNSASALQAEVQPSTATLGDVLILSINARHDPRIRVEPPAIPKTLGTFEVRASTASATVTLGNEAGQRFQLDLQNFTTGQQTIPALEFIFRDAQGHAQKLKTPELKVAIQEVPPGPKDQGDIRGIKGVLGPVAWSPWWGLLLALVGVGVGVFLWLKRQKKIQGPPPPPPVPADKAALKRLQELLTSGWIEEGRLKEFYSGLSDTVRGYVEDGFHIPALERTTTELLRDLRRHGVWEATAMVLLKDLLDECDLVKFAKWRPENDEALKTHAIATQIVEKTREKLRRKEE